MHSIGIFIGTFMFLWPVLYMVIGISLCKMEVIDIKTADRAHFSTILFIAGWFALGAALLAVSI